MPPAIALFICIIFVLFLLRLERKQTPNVSHFLWIPTIWMLSSASKPLGVWFGIEADAEGSPLDRVVLSGLLCLGLCILAGRKFGWARAIKENPWLILLMGYMLVSILWSDIPYTSFKRWIRELIAVVMAFLVLTERDPRKAVESLIRRTVYILIPISVLLIQYFPQYGRMYHRWTGELMWIGVTLQKNSLGQLCLISAFFLVWTLVGVRRRHDLPSGRLQTYAGILVLIITLWLLKGPSGAYAATAIVALAVGLAMFFSLIWMKNANIYLGRNALAAIMALVISFGVAAPIVGGVPTAGVSSALGRDETLTGRTEVWAELLPIVEGRPIWGSGFGGIWTPETRLRHDIGDAHNGYLDSLLELGAVGMLLRAMFLLSFCRKTQREMTYDFDWASLCICYLLMALIHNMAESSINSFTQHMTAVILFLSVSLPKNAPLPET